MKNILFYSILILSVFRCHTGHKCHKSHKSEPEENFGIDIVGLKESSARIAKTFHEVTTTTEKIAGVLVSPEGVNALGAIGQNTGQTFGQNFGQNIGVGALTTMGAGITQTALATKAGTISAATAAAPFVPYIVGSAAVAGTGYIGYKIYRVYNPNDEDMLKALILKAKLLQAENARIKESISLAKTQQESKQVEALRSLEICLAKNKYSRDTGISGRPTACDDAAFTFAMAAGSTKPLKKITKLYNESLWK